MTVPPADVKTADSPLTLTPKQALDSAVLLRAEIVEQAADTEARTFHSEDLHLQFMECGFYNMLRPKMFGGYEFSVTDFLTVVRELARGDMATAWCLALASGHNLQFASWWPESAQREIYGAGHFAAGMTSAPGGTMRRSDDGWVIDGAFPYSSGGPYSTHFMGHVFPITDESGERGPLSTFIVPRSEFTFRDDWGKTLGLRGSGSHTIDVGGATVPEHYVLVGQNQVSINVDSGTPGLELHRNPLYGGRGVGFFGLELATLAVGGVHGALDEYEQLLKTKKTAYPPITLREANPRFQTWYAEIKTQLAAADALLDHGADLFLEYATRGAEGGQPFSAVEDLAIGRMAAEAQKLAWNAMVTVMRTAGSSAAVSGSRLERIWRDSTMVIGHQNFVIQDFTAPDYTAALLGVTS
ncbi:acyl-CoA dehydrogenase family protein [Rhodococcus pyridinivorans]|uniref:acyl-CoA dehydrogenase family protein n=1 Tax=Rhodococcus pyridinivorans TaxID=103816 RepID=UPI001902E93F|nr:acyl-CoA dehydrogenase family protein [Rhodococcus pyridinivorans]MCW3472021.1 acyl-CoA dehydrogenase family protein [Rhodococcus pyridinivorans]QQM53004.1 acyl-CoA dehydrogenase family protein [Rhodococcus pyridinivorans]UPK61937.1 acyl-CoA dehydrogenase family protein [Rhodococcus pyridinivorans]